MAFEAIQAFGFDAELKGHFKQSPEWESKVEPSLFMAFEAIWAFGFDTELKGHFKQSPEWESEVEPSLEVEEKSEGERTTKEKEEVEQEETQNPNCKIIYFI